MLKVLLGFVPFLLMFFPLCSGKGNCEYSFVEQPPAQLKCNPWPYIEQTGNLSIHCDIVGPQNSDVPHVWWSARRRFAGRFIEGPLNIHHRKYFGPSSSGHNAQSGLKRVNFTLKITNVTSVDIGCYWCRVYVRSNTCTFVSPRSSIFCLQSVENYSHLNNCTELPVNSTPLCGASDTCGAQTMNSDVSTNQISRSSIPQLTVSHKTASVYSTAFSQPTPSASHATVTSNPVFSTAPQHSPSPDQLSSTTTGILHPETTAAISEAETSSGEPPDGVPLGGEDMVEPWLYVGVAVCLVLLTVIVVLVVGVVLLCRRKTRRPKGRSAAPGPAVAYNIHLGPSSWTYRPTLDEHTPRHRDSNDGVSFESSVSCNNSLRIPRSAQTPTSVVSKRDSMYSHTTEQNNGDTEMMEFPYYHVLEQSNEETGMDIHHYHVLEQSNEETGMEFPYYHVLEQSNGDTGMEFPYYHVLEQSNEETEMDVHHYHVLESPLYYNSSEEEAGRSGRASLLNTMRLSWQRFSRDSKVFPIPKEASCQDDDKTYASPWTKPTSDKSLPHIYKDLDQSTMEPIREYTRLIATK